MARVVVVYKELFSRADKRCFRQILKSEPRETGASESRVFACGADAEDARAEFDECWRPGSNDGLFVQPELKDIRVMVEGEAVELARRSLEWQQQVSQLRRNERTFFRGRELARCFVIAGEWELGGMPAGIGFLVDKHTGRVFPRRLIDVVDLDGELIG